MADEEQKTEAPVEGEEDSMEDILHSIRDIIADETSEEGGEKVEGADDVEAPEESEVDEGEELVLTDVVEEATPEPAEEAEAPADDTADVLADIDNALDIDENSEELSPEPEEKAEPEAVTVEAPAPEPDTSSEPAPEPKAEPTPSELLSGDTVQKSSESIKDLMDNIPQADIESPVFRSGNTLEDLVVESLKPLLADWLNENLPIIVERVVAKEIRKIVPKED